MKIESKATDERSHRLAPRPWSRIAERIESVQRTPDEARRALPVVFTVLVLSTAATFGVVSLGASSSEFIAVALVVVGLGLVADVLSFYELNKSSAGSIAQIPYLAAAILLPDYRFLLAVGVAQLAAQAWHRRPPIKATFNVAQVVLSCAVVVAVSRALIGATDHLSTPSFAGSAVRLAVPIFLMSAAYSIVNSLAVALVLSAVSGQRVLTLWNRANRRLLASLLLSTFFAIYLVWLSARLGAPGALGMLVPLLVVRQLSRTTIELTNVTEELLDLMVAAIEARDPYTSGHSKRVAQASKIIAQALSLKAEQIERVEVSALLHDVGKIDEQFARILAKEGRLTPEEWETMKRHPVRSAELVGMLSSLKDIVPTVRHHHENWDGTGYPDGISGEAIPLASRIVMFADTLDAITTDRPYRKALDPEEARKEFIKFKGKQFDPRICEVVVSDEVWKTLYQNLRTAHLAEAAQNERKAVA
ncbi:MAG: HD-GYP domain-containing protein [Gemmatimonadota bacterium]